MDRSSFTAVLVTVGPLEDVEAQVGWASDAVGAGPHLILMRGTDDDDYCIVSGDDETYATHYGGVVRAEVRADGTTVVLEPDAAAALGLPETVTIDPRCR